MAKNRGAEVPFLRPKELAKDTSGIGEAISYTIYKLGALNPKEPEYNYIQRPPLRNINLHSTLMKGTPVVNDIIKIENLQDRIIEIRERKVLIDADVAEIYGVETRDINKTVGNNPDKFPDGYVFELSDEEKSELVENFHRFNRLKHSTVNPKAFPEKGLYMLATILKSSQAVKATLGIIETFSKIRELSRNIKTLAEITDKKEQKDLMQKSGEIIAEIMEDDLQTTDTETTIELNFAVLKFKHVIKRKNK